MMRQIPKKLKIGHKVKTPQGKGKIIHIVGDLAEVLVGDEKLDMSYQGLEHIKNKKTNSAQTADKQ